MYPHLLPCGIAPSLVPRNVCELLLLLLPLLTTSCMYLTLSLWAAAAIIRLSDQFKTLAKRGNNYEMRVGLTVCNCFDKSRLRYYSTQASSLRRRDILKHQTNISIAVSGFQTGVMLGYDNIYYSFFSFFLGKWTSIL